MSDEQVPRDGQTQAEPEVGPAPGTALGANASSSGTNPAGADAVPEHERAQSIAPLSSPIVSIGDDSSDETSSDETKDGSAALGTEPGREMLSEPPAPSARRLVPPPKPKGYVSSRPPPLAPNQAATEAIRPSFPSPEIPNAEAPVRSPSLVPDLSALRSAVTRPSIAPRPIDAARSAADRTPEAPARSTAPSNPDRPVQVLPQASRSLPPGIAFPAVGRSSIPPPTLPSATPSSRYPWMTNATAEALASATSTSGDAPATAGELPSEPRATPSGLPPARRSSPDDAPASSPTRAAVLPKATRDVTRRSSTPPPKPRFVPPRQPKETPTVAIQAMRIIAIGVDDPPVTMSGAELEASTRAAGHSSEPELIVHGSVSGPPEAFESYPPGSDLTPAEPTGELPRLADAALLEVPPLPDAALLEASAEPPGLDQQLDQPVEASNPELRSASQPVKPTEPPERAAAPTRSAPPVPRRASATSVGSVPPTPEPAGLELLPVAGAEPTAVSPTLPSPAADAGDMEAIPESVEPISEDPGASNRKRPPPPRRNSMPSAPSDSHLVAAAPIADARLPDITTAPAATSTTETAPKQPPPAPSRTPRERPQAPERKSVPSVPAAAPANGSAAANTPEAASTEPSERPKARPRRPWWEELFGEDFSRATTRLVDAQIDQEVSFIEESLGVAPGAALLDLGCGAGYHAVELASRGYGIVGYDLSLHQLALAQEVAQERGQKLNFLQGDMREMAFEDVFDGMYCWNTTFGYFEEEKNVVVAERMFAALKPGGTLLLDVVNRDFVALNQPSSVWYEGDSCVCMDDMSVDFFTSRLRVKRSLILDDGRTRECHYSIRLYSLHELGRILHDIGFRVTEASGHPSTPGIFLGQSSPRIIILAQKP
jgi:SAM-dependent methyltransferase